LTFQNYNNTNNNNNNNNNNKKQKKKRTKKITLNKKKDDVVRHKPPHPGCGTHLIPPGQVGIARSRCLENNCHGKLPDSRHVGEPHPDILEIRRHIDNPRVSVSAIAQVCAGAATAITAKRHTDALVEHIMAIRKGPVGLGEREPEPESFVLRGCWKDDVQIIAEHALVPRHPVELVHIRLNMAIRENEPQDRNFAVSSMA
jgi:hypothetical protein